MFLNIKSRSSAFLGHRTVNGCDPSSAARQTLTKPNYTSESQASGGEDAPRIIKKRSRSARSDRRSKSLEHRKSRKVSLHNSIQKSKDDLDFGIFTIIERPPNPWYKENQLKKGKSCPDIQQGSNDPDKQRGLSISTPNLADSKEPLKESLELQQPNNQQSKDSNQCNGTGLTEFKVNVTTSNQQPIPASISDQTEDLLSNTETISHQRVKEEVIILHNQQSSFQSSEQRPSIEKEHSTIHQQQTSLLDIGQLKRYFSECVITVKSIVSEETGEEQNRLVLETQTKDLLQAEELKRSFESLLNSIDCVTEDFKITENWKTSHVVSESENLRELRNFVEPVVPHRRKITINTEASWSVDDHKIFDQGIKIIKDFLEQLLESSEEEETMKKFVAINKCLEKRTKFTTAFSQINHGKTVVTSFDEGKFEVP